MLCQHVNANPLGAVFFTYFRLIFIFITEFPCFYERLNQYSNVFNLFRSRDGTDIRFSILYPAGPGHFSAIQYPAGYWILKNWIYSFLISSRISSKPDISKTFLLLFEDLRCFNYLINSVEQRTGIEISGIRHPPDIRFSKWPDIRQNCCPVHP